MSDNLRDRIAKVLEHRTRAHVVRRRHPLQSYQDAWLQQADAVIQELWLKPELRYPNLGKVQTQCYPYGCDCSCCYGYDDSSCHCVADPCNCGGDRAAHGQGPL